MTVVPNKIHSIRPKENRERVKQNPEMLALRPRKNGNHMSLAYFPTKPFKCPSQKGRKQHSMRMLRTVTKNLIHQGSEFTRVITRSAAHLLGSQSQ